MSDLGDFKSLRSGGGFYEGPRWHDGAWWVTDHDRHAVLRVTTDGEEEEILRVEDVPSGMGWMPDGSLLDLFGSGGGAAVAERLGVPLLASVPLSAALRRAGDLGAPISVSPGDDGAAAALEALAAAVGGMGRELSGRHLPFAPV